MVTAAAVPAYSPRTFLPDTLSAGAAGFKRETPGRLRQLHPADTFQRCRNSGSALWRAQAAYSSPSSSFLSILPDRRRRSQYGGQPVVVLW